MESSSTVSRLTRSSLEAEVDGPPGDGGYRAQNSLERRRGEVHVVDGEKHVARTHARPLGVRAFANLRDADPLVARPLLADRLEHESERLLHADQALAGAVRVREAGAELARRAAAASARAASRARPRRQRIGRESVRHDAQVRAQRPRRALSHVARHAHVEGEGSQRRGGVRGGGAPVRAPQRASRRLRLRADLRRAAALAAEQQPRGGAESELDGIAASPFGRSTAAGSAVGQPCATPRKRGDKPRLPGQPARRLAPLLRRRRRRPRVARLGGDAVDGRRRRRVDPQRRDSVPRRRARLRRSASLFEALGCVSGASRLCLASA